MKLFLTFFVAVGEGTWSYRIWIVFFFYTEQYTNAQYQSGLGNNSNEKVTYIPQILTAGASQSDAV